ncbi:MAG: HD domain-containing protein [Gammaproteobacteria bacterium]|nr:HD domain-containing protein [Gammaproteobacteria bacterium]
MSDLYGHQDSFKQLESSAPLSKKLRLLHDMVRQQHDCIDRIAIALYDARQDMLKTFAWSSDQQSPLRHYQAKLADSPSLLEILERGQPRVVNDMDIFTQGSNPHTQILNKSGFGSSYTMPLYQDGEFLGFIFFNSFQKGALKESLLNDLDVVGHMISLLVSNQRTVLETLRASVHTAMHFTHQRDPETAQHIDRMSRYSRLIARELADEHGFDDQFVEHVFLFSPLHDLGKLGIPDRVLLKQGKLDEDEFELMKTHAVKGREMIDSLLKNYGLDGVGYVDMLRNIAMHHHEAFDGSGYPDGLVADNIPIEARIVAVADVFDALTSKRPYKEAWSNDQAFAAMRDMENTRLDARCVEILIEFRDEVEQIQQQFRENPYG